MNSDVKKRYNDLTRIIGISLFFFVNIGSKEIFRYLDSFSYVSEGVLIMTGAFSIFLLRIPKRFSQITVVLFFLYIYLVISSLSGSDPIYGLQKSFLGIFVPLILFSFMVKRRYSKEEFISAYIFMISVLCVVALVFKFRAGFFDRTVRFGLLGPITFGWLNGMAFLLMFLKVKKTSKDIVKGIFFFLMVIWTGSKGPLLAMLVVSFFSFNKILGSRLRTKVLSLLALILLFRLLYAYSDDIRSIKTALDFMESPDEYAEGAGRGSIGVRQEYLDISYERFIDHPILGVGFGGWNGGIWSIEHKYPHNIVFEILAELGLVGLIIFMFLFFNLKFKGIFGFLGVYGLISLLFSGDISYFRYSLFPFLIALYFAEYDIKNNRSNSNEFKELL